MLLKKASFETLMVRSGEEALSLLQQGATPDLIFTDLVMGKMDGVELIGEVRKITALRITPIVMLTSEAHAGRRKEAHRAGANGWLVKPVNGGGLLAVIAQLVPAAVD